MSRSRVKTMKVFFRQPWYCAQTICTSRTITPSTKMSWNDFENGPSESEGTLQTIGFCSTITRQLTALSIPEFLVKKNIPVFPNPP